MRIWTFGAMLFAMAPGPLSAQSVSYQVQLAPGEVVLNTAGSGRYVQRGDIALLAGQMISDAASVAEAEAMNQQNFDMLVNSLGTLGVSPAQIRKATNAQPGQPTAGQARSGWQIRVELLDQSRMGEILTAMEAAEVRSIQPAQYDVADRDALVNFARQRAIADARRQAEAYASVLTKTVRRIGRIDEISAKTVTGAAGNGVSDGEVAAMVEIKVDFVLGPMFSSAATPSSGTP